MSVSYSAMWTSLRLTATGSIPRNLIFVTKYDYSEQLKLFNAIKHWYGGLGEIRVILSYAILMLTQRESIDEQTLDNSFHDMNGHYQLLRLLKI